MIPLICGILKKNNQAEKKILDYIAGYKMEFFCCFRFRKESLNQRVLDNWFMSC